MEKTPVTEPASAPLAPSVLEALARYDTPTICNAMEIVAPARRLIGSYRDQQTDLVLVLCGVELGGQLDVRAHGKSSRGLEER